jgi:hypothetical protein
MKHLKPLISYLLPIALALIVAFGYKKSGGPHMHLCEHQFALCTSAKCIPEPGDSSKAICFCDVINGPSMSTAACDTVKPTTDSHGVRTLYSAFALDQFKDGKRGMKCPDGTPWTWCLNKQCTVDPLDSKRAICTCDVVYGGEWMTLGGDCNTSSCETGYWSGATMNDVEEGSSFLAKALGLEKPPIQWCQSDVQ